MLKEEFYSNMSTKINQEVAGKQAIAMVFLSIVLGIQAWHMYTLKTKNKISALLNFKRDREKQSCPAPCSRDKNETAISWQTVFILSFIGQFGALVKLAWALRHANMPWPANLHILIFNVHDSLEITDYTVHWVSNIRWQTYYEMQRISHLISCHYYKRDSWFEWIFLTYSSKKIYIRR